MTQTKLTKAEQSMLESLTKTTEQLGAFRYIKVNFFNECWGVWKNGSGKYNKTNSRAILGLIDKGVLTYKCTTGMWQRFYLTAKSL